MLTLMLELSRICSHGSIDKAITFARINSIANESQLFGGQTCKETSVRADEIFSKLYGIDEDHEAGIEHIGRKFEKIDRVVLEPVLHNLDKENDIVLFTALSDSPIFQPRQKVKRKKRRQKRPPLRTPSEVLSTESILYADALIKLIQKGFSEKSLVALLGMQAFFTDS